MCAAAFLKNLYMEECEASYSFFHVSENVQRLQCVCVGRSNKEGLDSGLIDVHNPVKAIASSFFLFKILNFLDFDAHKKQFPVPYVHHLRAFAGQNWETVKSTVFLSSRM